MACRLWDRKHGSGTYDGTLDEQNVVVAWLNFARVSASVPLELDRAMQRETGISLLECEVLYRLYCLPEAR